MYILGIHNRHDAAACLFKDQKLIAYCKEERLSRIKNEGDKFDMLAIDEVLGIAGITRKDVDVFVFGWWKLPLQAYRKTSRPIRDGLLKLFGSRDTRRLLRETRRLKTTDPYALIDQDAFKKLLGAKPDAEIRFANHHLGHALGPLKYTDWDEALYLTLDGYGDGAVYSAHYYKDNKLETLHGHEEQCLLEPHDEAYSLGFTYACITRALGFMALRHEGKITGLAAYGKPLLYDEIISNFKVCDDGRFDTTKICGKKDWRAYLEKISVGHKREDVAASVQKATEDVACAWIKALLKTRPVKYLGLSGGFFANVRVNQLVSEIPGVEEIFVFPAMGDEGLAVGFCVDVLIEKFGLDNLQRERLNDVYLGYPYDSDALISAAEKHSEFEIKRLVNPAKYAAKLLHEDYVGAIFAQRMEMGPRALGARSILASPRQRDINDSLNNRLDRTEFMPFAPFVREEDAADVFEINDCNRYACRFMTITADVKAAYRDVIPAAVHVDNTARPQIIERDLNPLYYDILTEFKAVSGIPCLVNTSFNAHEEPIINTPEEALQALFDDRIDFLVCEAGIIYKGNHPVGEGRGAY